MDKKIFVVIFLLILYSPLILDVFKIKPGVENIESQPLLPLSSLLLKTSKQSNGILKTTQGFYVDIVEYKHKYKNYYNDNFVLKSFLFQPFYWIKTSIFKIDPLPDEVVEGEDGWFFLGDAYSDVILESKGIINFNTQELNQLKSGLLKQKALYNKQGITHYIAVAPNKHSIYGDKIPILNSNRNTKLEQLKIISAQSDINLIDMSTYFKLSQKRLYHKTNTHWNDMGAYLGYVGLMTEIIDMFPEAKIIALDSLDRKIEISWEEDLTKLLFVKRKEERITLEIKNPTAIRIQNILGIPKYYNRNPKDYEMRYISNANNLKVLILRDSFCSALVKYISESFGETVFIWSHQLDKKIITNESPDIIITQIVERNLDELFQSQLQFQPQL